MIINAASGPLNCFALIIPEIKYEINIICTTKQISKTPNVKYAIPGAAVIIYDKYQGLSNGVGTTPSYFAHLKISRQ